MSSPIKGYLTSKSGSGAGHSVTVTTLTGDKVALDVNVLAGTLTGTFTPSGLRTAFRNTTMDVTDRSALMSSGAYLKHSVKSMSLPAKGSEQGSKDHLLT